MPLGKIEIVVGSPVRAKAEFLEIVLLPCSKRGHRLPLFGGRPIRPQLMKGDFVEPVGQ